MNDKMYIAKMTDDEFDAALNALMDAGTPAEEISEMIDSGVIKKGAVNDTGLVRAS